jgi:hypothetical protein
VAAGLMDPCVLPMAAEGLGQVLARNVPAAASCDRQHFVPNKVKPNSLRRRLVKEKRRRCVDHVPAQFIPSVALSENIFRQALGAITAIGVLDGLKHQIGHIQT